MPKRPKQHQVEDLSIIAFKSKLPREWVYREKDKDYGIDGEVEIFDKDDSATGLIFLVQLKSTDSMDKNKQQRVQLSNESINYYKELELPTLIVRYVEKTDTIYYKWAYKIDRYKMKKDAKSFSFLMQENEEWNSETSALLHNELEKFRKIKKTNTLLPLNIYLDFKFTKFLNCNSSTVKSHIREYIQDKLNFIDIVSNYEDAFCIVNMSKDILSTNIIGSAGNIIHDYHIIDYKSIENFVPNIFIAITMNLFELGKGTDALKIIKHFVSLEDLPIFLEQIDISLYLIEHLIAMHEEQEAFKLWLLLSDNVKEEIKPYLNILLVKTKSLDTYEKFLEEEIHISIKNNDNLLTGTFCYNLANILHNNNRHKEAIKYYNLALKYNKNYCKRDYIYKEIAGSLFLLRKYNSASKYYKFGIELKEELKTIILYADTLMMIGEYKQSLEYMEIYFDKKTDVEEEWILKSFILEFLMEELNIPSQKRSYEQAMQTDILAKVATEKVSEEDLLSVLNIDALSPLAWYNLGQIYLKQKNFERAMFGFLITGLINDLDLEAWYNAFICAISSEGIILLEPILRVGYYKVGEEFIRIVDNNFIEKIDDDKFKTEMYSLLDDIVNKKDGEEPIIRIS